MAARAGPAFAAAHAAGAAGWLAWLAAALAWQLLVADAVHLLLHACAALGGRRAATCVRPARVPTACPARLSESQRARSTIDIVI